MMPPKKSKAARSATEDAAVVEKEKPIPEMKDKKKEEKKEEKEEVVEEEEREEVNIFNTELVFGKRHRVAPSGQHKLLEWIENHLEANEECNYHATDVYNVYLEGCISSNTFAVELLSFVKEVKQSFPKGFCIRADSPYHGAVKERKQRKTTEKSARSPSAALKTRELLKGVFDDSGNPKKGLRFNSIKKLLIAKHPALQLDARPALLKGALNRALYFGHVRLVKGIGCAGFYRWVVKGEEEEEDDEEEEEDEKKSKKVKGEKSEENGVSSDAKTDEEGEKEQVKDGEDGGEKKSGEEEKKKKKKKKKKQQKPVWSSKLLVHSEPEKITDSFQMAMTFMSDPKMASVSRIKKYVLDHYHQDVDMEKLRKTLQAGVDKGSWGQVTGASATSGSYQLLLEDFDPLEDDDLAGKITNAIMASHEPKQCSFGLLKRYVAKYHPNFKVEERPSRLRKAVERALEQGLIRRLTGIGCSGTFQLAKPFVPSPSVLAGNDTASDYEADMDYSDSEFGVQKGVKGLQISDFQDAYKPRPTKRHGRQAAKKAQVSVSPVVKTERRGRPAKSAVREKVPKKEPKYRDTTDEESDVEVSEKRKKKSLSKKSTPSPNKAKGRGRPAKKTTSKKSSPVKIKPEKKSTPKKTAKKLYVESSDEEEEEREEEKKATPKRTPKKLYVESSDDEEEEEEEMSRVPTKASRKAKPASSSAGNQKKSAAKRKKAEMGSGRSSLRTSMVSYAEVNDSEEEDGPEKKKKKKKKKNSK